MALLSGEGEGIMIWQLQISVLRNRRTDEQAGAREIPGVGCTASVRLGSKQRFSALAFVPASLTGVPCELRAFSLSYTSCDFVCSPSTDPFVNWEVVFCSSNLQGSQVVIAHT